MKLRNILFILALSVLLSLGVFAENQKIKVGLYFGSTAKQGSVSLSFENGFDIGFCSDDGSFFSLDSSDYNNVTVKADGDYMYLEAGDGTVIYEAYDGDSVDILSLEGSSDIPYCQVGGIKYPDIIRLSSNGGYITVINIVDAEQYFKGVLPSEVYPSWHPEALKAAAVATRTYTYHSMNGKHSAHGVDLCNTTCCQVYSGIAKCQESTNSAVEETENLVLTYDGNLITAVYHAISGGITESAAGAWGGSPESFPYLTVVKTPFELYYDIARGKWTKVLYDEDFDTLIYNYYGSAKISAPIKSIKLDDSTPGYLNNMTITGADGNSVFLKTSSNIRSFFSVISSNFTIGRVYMPSDGIHEPATVLTADGEYTFGAGEEISIITADGSESVSGIRSAYFIDGKGYGHGVGLSQYGAQFAAKEGYSYEEILSTYYPGTILEDYTEMFSDEYQD